MTKTKKFNDDESSKTEINNDDESSKTERDNDDESSKTDKTEEKVNDVNKLSNLDSQNIVSKNMPDITKMTEIFSNANRLATLDLQNIISKSMPDITKMTETFNTANRLAPLELQNIVSKSMPDITKMVETFSTANRLAPLELQNIVSKSMPDITKMAEIAHRANELANPNIQAIVSKSMPDITKMVETFSTANRWATLDLQNIISKSMPDITKMTETFKTAVKLSDSISNINWATFEPTEESIEQGYRIIQSENLEENLSKELESNKESNTFKSAVAIIIYLFFIFAGSMEFLSNTVNVIEFTEDKIIPTIQKAKEYKEKGLFDSNKEEIKWINNILKKDISPQIKYFFRIVTMVGLKVRKRKKVKSKINGTLKSTDVVKVIKKSKNWTYISYYDEENNELIEGWTFTRYLKKIK